MRLRASAVLDAVICLAIFGVLPFILYRLAEDRFGVALGAYGVTALLLSLPIAALSLLKGGFEKGDRRRFVLSVAQIVTVAVWLFVAVAPTIFFKYGKYDITITLLSYLLLLAAVYSLNIFHAYVEYRVHRRNVAPR